MTFDSLILWLESIGPIKAALIATTFTWALTAAGASLVFFFKSMHRKWFDGMLGFTGGVMVAASFWSLLSPAIEMSGGEGFAKVTPAAIGFGLGALFIFALDKFTPHLHINFKKEEAEGPSTDWHRSTLLVLAITLHNIPEGLTQGIPFDDAGDEKLPSVIAEPVVSTPSITTVISTPPVENQVEQPIVVVPEKRLVVCRLLRVGPA